VEKNTPILIVDDYRTMLRIIRNLLIQLGFTDVDEASDGQTALTMLQGKSYGLVISDWNMEPMSGLQFLQAVRTDVRLKDLPFIMITAQSRSDSVVEAKEAGASNYIVKPFNAETLSTKIRSVLSA
jgi:two-component system chemotaxis response regulator CheY